jgi:hypothetical protein
MVGDFLVISWRGLHLRYSIVCSCAALQPRMKDILLFPENSKMYAGLRNLRKLLFVTCT